MKKMFCFIAGLTVFALHPLCADGMSPEEEAFLAGKEFFPPPPATLPGETDETQEPVGPPDMPQDSTSPAQQVPPAQPEGEEMAPAPSTPQQPPAIKRNTP